MKDNALVFFLEGFEAVLDLEPVDAMEVLLTSWGFISLDF
jgi:hypothetical protein